MANKIIQRFLEPIDERLPYKQFIAEARKQADAVPLEITEDGIVYKMFDHKMKIEGTMNTTIALYKVKPSQRI